MCGLNQKFTRYKLSERSVTVVGGFNWDMIVWISTDFYFNMFIKP